MSSNNNADLGFDGQLQRFEFVNEKTSKFWEIRVSGRSLEVRHGKIATEGQRQAKGFDSESEAQKYAEKLVEEKLNSGYWLSLKPSPMAVETTEHSNDKLSSPSNALIQQSPAKVTPALSKKIELFYALKAQLISSIELIEYSDEFKKNILSVLNKADLTYSVYGELMHNDEIPRTASMVCGPSFVSEEYPQPVNSNGDKMFPVLQLDMEWIGRLTNRIFKPELIQLWWSSDPSEGFITVIPKHKVNATTATLIDFPESAESWIPYEWLSEEKNSAYLITKCLPIGVTYPSLDNVFDYEFFTHGEKENRNEISELLNKLCVDSSFSSPNSLSKNRLFNIFGYFKSHSCPAWEMGSEMCLLNTCEWAYGMMDANIFMQFDSQGEVNGFNFSFGR